MTLFEKSTSMQIIPFPAHYQLGYHNFDFSSFSRISCIPKAAVLHGKSVGFALQKSRFRNAKSKLSFFAEIIFTKRKGFLRKSTLNEWEKNSIATTTAERFLCNLPKESL